MKTNRFRGTLVAALLMGSVSLWAADEKKPAAAPKPAAKPAAAPKAAAPAAARPAGGAPGAAGRPAGAVAGAPGRPAGGAAGAPGAAGRPAGAPGAAVGGAAAGRANPAAGREVGGRPGGGGAAPGNRALPAGHKEVALRGGGSAHVDERGRVREVHRDNMDVHRGVNGNRRVEGRLPDGRRVVVGRGREGYVSGRYAYGGHEFAHRTYYEHGRAYDRFYRGYPYHGVYLEGYAPVRYYAPAYYGWAYNPWAAPIAYSWGWVGNPWAVYYGGYFTPYPVYPSASLWLTDYLISTSLQAQYEANVAAANGAALAAYTTPPAPLTPDVKQMIAAEVQRQLALENAEAQQVAKGAEPDPASSGIARMLQDGMPHVFVAGSELDVTDSSGQECSLAQGDVVQLNTPPPADSPAATLIVMASKPRECPRGSSVTVQLTDLQEMQNHMRQTIDSGLGDLQTNAGKGGLPAVPVAAKAAPTPAPFAALAPPPDPSAAQVIAQQAQEADKAEQEAGSAQLPDAGNAAATVAPVAAPPPPAPEPATISKGMTIAQATTILGQPKTILDLGGGKKIYVFKDVKLTFGADGKMTSAE
jgi:hypothetical protein